MKYLSGLIVTVLTATLLSGGFTAPANGGYAPTVRTFCDAFAARNPIRDGQRAITKYRVRAEDGTRTNARISYSITDKRSGAVVGEASRRYRGGTDRIKSPRLDRGKYVVSVSAVPGADRYLGCSARHGVRVKKKRRR